MSKKGGIAYLIQCNDFINCCVGIKVSKVVEHPSVKNEVWMKQTPGLVTASVSALNPLKLCPGRNKCLLYKLGATGPQGSMLHCEVQA